MTVWGNFIIDGVRFDGPQEHWMSCSIYRDAKDNLPGSGGYKCDCNYKELKDMAQGCSCGAPIPCTAPAYGGRHVPRELWDE